MSLFKLFAIGYYDTTSEEYYYAPGWIWSRGNLGVVKWDGMLLGNLPSKKIPLDSWLFEIAYPAVWGFNGIKITLNYCNRGKFYIGTALAVGLDEKNEV